MKFSGIAKKTPRDRILRAVAEELLELSSRALEAAESLSMPLDLAADDAVQALRSALAQGEGWDPLSDAPVPKGIAFPRAALEVALGRALSAGAESAIVSWLRTHIDKHVALERRIEWLLGGTSFEEVARLDPLADCDRIFHALSSAFRVESRVLELLSINRISQSTSVSVFFRSTKEAETNGVHRFYDTWGLVANFFEWGEDSKRGRAAAQRMRDIHGRYYIPNAGMKYVLLETAFTWLDGIDRLGHRPLLDVERKGYFHAYVKLGLSSNIAEINHDYDEMYGWYKEFNRVNGYHRPLKTETFETLVKNSMAGFDVPGMKELMLIAARAGMDDTYRGSLAYAAPSASELSAVRAVFFTLGQALARLPPTPFVRSLQNNPARSGYNRPEQLGVSERSRHMARAYLE